jgi:hypothetical protein
VKSNIHTNDLHVGIGEYPALEEFLAEVTEAAGGGFRAALPAVEVGGQQPQVFRELLLVQLLAVKMFKSLWGIYTVRQILVNLSDPT